MHASGGDSSFSSFILIFFEKTLSLDSPLSLGLQYTLIINKQIKKEIESFAIDRSVGNYIIGELEPIIEMSYKKDYVLVQIVPHLLFCVFPHFKLKIETKC